MMGLDMVKGPHWSQILSLFGPSGSMSQILADRTQVQLKDKARNLKLFFLKTNSEMPYYLQCVTGELKTRAPTQAANSRAAIPSRCDGILKSDLSRGLVRQHQVLQRPEPDAHHVTAFLHQPRTLRQKNVPPSSARVRMPSDKKKTDLRKLIRAEVARGERDRALTAPPEPEHHYKKTLHALQKEGIAS